MTVLIQAVSRFSRTASNADTTWKVLLVFCLAGLVISLIGGADFPQELVP